MADQDFYDLIAQADPETLKMLIGAGLVPSQNAAIDNMQMAKGQNVGNTYVAASPVEHLANALKSYKQQQLIKQQGQGREAYLRLLAKQNAPQANPAAQEDPSASGAFLAPTEM